MRLMIDSTSEVEAVEGLECRVWNGVTELGLPVRVLIPVVVVPAGSPVAKHLAKAGQKYREAGS